MESQRILIKDYLLKHRIISNDDALQMGITRLAVMIERLREEGMWIDLVLPNGKKPGIYIYASYKGVKSNGRKREIRAKATSK